MKNQLKKLTEEKGFKSRFTAFTPTGDIELEELMSGFWMYELQKWLREKHDIHVTVLPYNDVEVNQILWENSIIDIKDDWNETSDYTYYHTYEEALEGGLIRSLNLVL